MNAQVARWVFIVVLVLTGMTGLFASFTEPDARDAELCFRCTDVENASGALAWIPKCPAATAERPPWFDSTSLAGPEVCTETECGSWRRRIKGALDAAERCRQDDDCVLVSVPCPFQACARPLRGASYAPIAKDIEAFHRQCLECCSLCEPPRREVAVCINERCQRRASLK